MELFGLALLLLAAVLLSSVIAQVVPRVSAPLVQIALGLLIALVASQQITIDLDPNLFLVLLIAPIIFYDTRKADNYAFWHYRHAMFSYAIVLVFVTMVVIGLAIHWLIPSIPLAAGLALGAALAPTDTVSVEVVLRDANIPESQKSILKGESLLNDGSGLISFQIAMSFVVTGTFSLAATIVDFLIVFFGAIALGTAFGFLVILIKRTVQRLGVENTTFHVLLEVFIPFIVFLLGNSLNVSSVIAVIACGITLSAGSQSLRPSISRMNIVSSSVWDVLIFTLNGIVFVLLGTQLPHAMANTWVDAGINNLDLIMYVLLLTVLMNGVRFIWAFATEIISSRKDRANNGMKINAYRALISTLAGTKGAITLAIMFTLPNWVYSGTALVAFPGRNLLIFLSCGVILITLLVATFIMPLVVPQTEDTSQQKHKRDLQARVDILRTVIAQLNALQTDETRRATSKVILQYNERIKTIQSQADLPQSCHNQLRIRALQWEQEYIQQLIESEAIPAFQGYRYLNLITRVEAMLQHGRNRFVTILRQVRRAWAMVRSMWHAFLVKLPLQTTDESQRVMREIQIKANEHVLTRLRQEIHNPQNQIPIETYSRLIVDYQRSITLLRSSRPSVTALSADASTILDISREGLRIELEQIQIAYEEDRISREGAQSMRENVYVMQLDLEDYV